MKTNNMIKWLFLMTSLLLNNVLWSGTNTALGEQAFARGSYDRALEHFSKAIEAKESGGKAHFFTGQILENRRKFQESMPYYSTSVELGLPNDLKKAALWKLVIFNERVGNWERLLYYVERLERMGVRHQNLSRSRARAESYLTPDKRRARVLITEARELEEQYSEEMQQSSFFRQEREKVRSIISKYSEAIRLDSAYKSYNWKVANYYEKLQDWRAAFKIYSDLAEDAKGKSRAIYKMGVSERRLGNFESSKSYLEEAVKISGNEHLLRYYAQINLAQSLFAMSDFTAAKKVATDALQTSKRIKTKDGAPALVMQCLAAYANREPSAKICKKNVAQNLADLKGWVKGATLILAGAYSFENPTQRNTAYRYWHTALLPPNENAEISDEEEDDDTGSDWTAPPVWMRPVVAHVCESYSSLRPSEGLYQILILYQKNLNNLTQYDLWLARSAYAASRHKEAAQAFARLASIDEKDNRAYWISLARDNQTSKLQRVFQQHMNGLEKDQLIKLFTWIETEESFRAWRAGKSYSDFRDSYLKPKEPEPVPESETLQKENPEESKETPKN